MTERAADLALEPYLLGQSASMAVAGVVTWVVTLVVVDHPLVVVAAGAVGSLAGLGTVWLIARRVGQRLYGELAVGAGPVGRSRTTALRLGAWWGLLTVAVMLLVGVFETLVLDLDVYPLFGPLLLTFVFAQLYNRRQLLTWQDRHGLAVCTRAGVRRFAWTRAGARSRLLVVPLGTESA